MFLPAITLLSLSSCFLYICVRDLSYSQIFLDLAECKSGVTRNCMGYRKIDGQLLCSVFQVFDAVWQLMCFESGRAMGIVLLPPA